MALPTNNSFEGIVPEFQNRGIHTLLTEVFEWRTQLTTRPECKAQGGWTDQLNDYLMEGLENLRETLERVTYRKPTQAKDTTEAQSQDTAHAQTRLRRKRSARKTSCNRRRSPSRSATT